jgi:hypothetical protein
MNIETFLKKKAELQAELKQHAKGMIEQLFRDMFDTLPEVKTATWTQYTPYFNDGDACVFGVNSCYLSKKYPEDIADFGPYGSDESGAEESDWLPCYGADVTDAQKEFERKFNSAEDVLEFLGDGVHVVVTNRPEGVVIEVQEYEHD